MTINISEKAIYFGAGCGIGLLVGALLAPQSGRETRQNLSDKVDDFTHKVQEKIQSSGIRNATSRTLHNVIDRGRNVASMGRERFRESVEAGTRRFDESFKDEEVNES
jgi:gas vesicle protein